VKVTVNEKKSLEISEFVINPSTASRNQLIEFGLKIENTGNTRLSVTPEILIYHGSELVEKISFGELVINAGSYMALSTSWNTGRSSDGVYNAIVTISYDNTTITQAGSFYIKPPENTQVRRSGGGGGGIVFIPGTSDSDMLEKVADNIELVEVPVLIELIRGEKSVFYLGIRNKQELPLNNLELKVSGIPDEWIRFNNRISIDSGSEFEIDFTVIPDRVGDYRAGITISGEEFETDTSFIIRVKDYPEDWTFPIINRNVVLKDKDEVRVLLKIENNGIDTEEFEVIETIPKSLASSIDQLRFDRKPDDILEPDPVVRWIVKELRNGETVNISYVILNKTDDLKPAIYWPVKQILKHAQTTSPEPVEDVESQEVEKFIPSLYTAIILLDTIVIIGVIFVFVQVRNYLRRR
jgi:hypothetical protein